MIPLLLLAGALLIAPPWSPGAARLARLRAANSNLGGVPLSSGWIVPSTAGLAVGALVGQVIGGPLGALVAVPLAAGAALLARRVAGRERPEAPDPLTVAGGWDLLAACLRSGLPVPLAVRAIAEHVPTSAAEELNRVADRLALGADPATAWDVPEASPVHPLARAARRSAHTGASLASVAEATAAEIRAAARDLAAARGQRAGVLITGPLGLCFLPAFLALGVAPVVIGLASGLEVAW
jgi:Flp pilus assembly protein TadB